MNTSYTQAEYAQLQAQVARFISREVQPRAAAWQDTRTTPQAVLQRMGRVGLPGLTVSAGYGGGDADADADALSQSSFGGEATRVMLQEVAKRYGTCTF